MHEVLLTLFLFFGSIKNSIACKLKTPFAKASIRKSCVSLKSQANALTFIFLSGIVFSQSLIVAYNFVNSTAQDMSFSSDGMITPTGFAVGIPEQGETGQDMPAVVPVLEEHQEESGDDTPITESADSEQQQAPEEPAPETQDNQGSTVLPEISEANETEEIPQSETPEPSVDENETREVSIPALPELINETTSGNETIDEPENETTMLELVLEIPELPTGNNGTSDVPDITVPFFEEATLDVSLVFPSDIKREGTFTLVVRLANTGSAPANNIVVEPLLPAGAITTESSKSINSLAAGEFSEVDFIIQLSYETLLGENEIKVRVAYE